MIHNQSWHERTQKRGASTGAVSVAVEVTTRGAYRSDTVRSVIQAVPSLAERAVYRKVQLCRGGAAWTAIADRPFNDEKIVWLTLPNPKIFASAYVTDVRSPRPFSTFPCDADDERVESEIALFTLGGLGDPLQAARELDFNVLGIMPLPGTEFHIYLARRPAN
jgi:hypothetical protein